MKFLSTVLLFLTLCCGVFANELIEISREIDFFETSFINAAGEPITSENHTAVERRIRNFHSRLSRLQMDLRKAKVPGVPNFVIHSIELKRIFDNFGVFNQKKGRLPYLKHTGMSDYNRIFLRNQRQQQRSKNQPRPRSATLKNIDLGSYCAWIDEICQANIGLIRRRKNIKSATRSSIESYILCIGGLRKCVATLAQNKYYKPR